ncbi:hypothetical protein MKW92_027389 [Papaver armeniacum]|nr:hypothetical protein MKW92_027389 [Papaver armeniacum]
MTGESRVHPDCRNASNPYHVCVEFCFLRIAERSQSEPKQVDTAGGGGHNEALHDQGISQEEHADEGNVEVDYAGLTKRQKKIEAPQETRGISKQKWMEDRKEKIGKLLDSNGLDMAKAYMLDTQEAAEAKYKKWEKKLLFVGMLIVFNQKTLYNAYKKRTKNIDCNLEEYNKMKQADPEFYREASSLQYGKAPKISEDKIDKMVKELYDRDSKGKSFSRRRKFHEEKYIDSINDRNEHFNKKIERAFGKYTLDIKNNLERGTALPD